MLTSCGYHFINREGVECAHTISIPFVKGDEYGYLTSALVQEISSRTPWKYTYAQGDLTLVVCLSDWDSDNIGYRFAPPKNAGGEKKVVVAQEGRITVTASVTLINRHTGQVVCGPLEVSQSLTFDFEPDFTNVKFHQFSLGQLEMRPLAEQAAYSSLDTLLAQKIVDVLHHCW